MRRGLNSLLRGRYEGPRSSRRRDTLAFELRFQGRKRIHISGELVVKMVAKRLVECLDLSGYVMTDAEHRGVAVLDRANWRNELVKSGSSSHKPYGEFEAKL